MRMRTTSRLFECSTYLSGKFILSRSIHKECRLIRNHGKIRAEFLAALKTTFGARDLKKINKTERARTFRSSLSPDQLIDSDYCIGNGMLGICGCGLFAAFWASIFSINSL